MIKVVLDPSPRPKIITELEVGKAYLAHSFKSSNGRRVITVVSKSRISILDITRGETYVAKDIDEWLKDYTIVAELEDSDFGI